MLDVWYTFDVTHITDLCKLLEGLTREHDSLLQERELVRAEEERITRRREELDRQISGLQQSVQGLSLYATAGDKPAEVTVDRDELIAPVMRRVRELCSGVAPSQVTARTLIECCRQILRLKADWMSALDVRQALHAARFDFSEYKSNPLSSIHTTLKRIAESGQAWSRESSGENLYRWKTSGENAPLQPESSPETPVSAAREEPTK
jgi:hypothetical protein